MQNNCLALPGGVDEIVDWSKTAPKRKFKRPADTAGDFDDKVSPLSTLKRGAHGRRQCEACCMHLCKMSEGGRHDRCQQGIFLCCTFSHASRIQSHDILTGTQGS